MKTFKSIIILAIIVCALTTSVSRTEKKRKMKKKAKAMKSSGLNDWEIEKNHLYKVYVYVNSQEVYTTAQFQCDTVYPAKNANKSGWNLKEIKAAGEFAKVAEKVGDTYKLDYKNCAPFIPNTSYSIWGFKGKTISSVCLNKGKSYKVIVMFEYAPLSSYITANDLLTMTTSLNQLRTNRNVFLNSLKDKCIASAGEYESYGASVTNLSEPTTETLVASISKANADKALLDAQAVITEAEVGTQLASIAALNKKIAEANNNLTVAAEAESVIAKLIKLKTAEIATYTLSQTNADDERALQKVAAEGLVQKAKDGFIGAMAHLITACPKDKRATTAATTKFNATPYNPVPVVSTINTIYSTGN